MKLGCYVLGVIALLFGVMVSDVSAATQDFEISTNYTWKHDTLYRTCRKDLTNKYSSVGWRKSSSSNHKMWFRVIDELSNEKGKGLLNHLAADAFVTNLTQYQSYYLQARRENSTDLVVKVSGIWAA